MPLGQVYKYNKNRKYSIIRPKTWGDTLKDVLFLSSDHDLKKGDTVEYNSEVKNKKTYATFIKKIG